MRVIAKKRCRAMFEPPEKGERATPNPNLSTRLNLLFSDQALGRRVGYCWSRRASVPRLFYNAKTLKLCSKIKFATQAQQTGAVSIRCRMFSVMSEFVQVFGRRHDEPFHTLWRPASKKRQGTKSREVWHWRRPKTCTTSEVVEVI